jgi:peroxiredoxin
MTTAAAPSSFEEKKSSNSDQKNAENKLLQPGDSAPDFCLPSSPDQKVSLHEFKGKPVVLVFYPADWSPVCGDQLALYSEVLPEIRNMGAELLAISVDNVWSHLAYARDRKIHFPVLADFEPKGQVAREYGAYEETSGTCSRALFVIDQDGKIHWSYLSPIGVNPGADGILSALEGLQSKTESQELGAAL